MNLPEVIPYEEVAVDTIVTIINLAKTKLGERQNLHQLAHSRDDVVGETTKVSLLKLETPFVKNAEDFIKDTIERDWKLTNMFKFIVRFLGTSTGYCTHFLYYEAVFSQPTESYPIPQVTVSVFFRVKIQHMEPMDIKRVPDMIFRVEGQHTDHDVRHVLLNPDWILAAIRYKTKIFERIEAVNLF